MSHREQDRLLEPNRIYEERLLAPHGQRLKNLSFSAAWCESRSHWTTPHGDQVRGSLPSLREASVTSTSELDPTRLVRQATSWEYSVSPSEPRDPFDPDHAASSG